MKQARIRLVATVFVAGGLAFPVAAMAHLERPSYWPDPAADTSITPPAGGKVPKARSLASAVTGAGPGVVRVVCQKKSLTRALASIRSAKEKGFRLRPSQPVVRLSAKKARALAKINRALFKQCSFNAIQPAIDASGNNDRIVIMPGRYTEPASRAKPENDPVCNPSLVQKDASGDPTPSYEYQVTCPHDQNLIYVAGRAVVGKPLETPRTNRQGIPEQELGPCVRCNLQFEGSGPKPTDTLIDAGKDYTGKGPEAKPGGYTKDVVMRVDRADGFVGRNFLVRGAQEHGFYNEEVDGILLDRVKFFWNADYGQLSFTSDHLRIQNCDGMGAGDAALYPGASPDTGSQATDFYPDAPRYNTTITKCDMRNSTLGYSGSMGNAVRITNNHIYGNTTGIASDTLSSAGHPGFPADSAKVDNNFIYANNFNTYRKDSPVDALVTVPIGTGIIYAGMNDARVNDNWFFDNWRFGAMLFAVPDPLTSFGGPEGDVYPGVSCPGAPENQISTSCGNHFFNNRMGEVPKGFRFPAVLDKYKIPHSDPGKSAMPNGTDFWWDEWSGNTGNCWYDNVGFKGTPAEITGPGEPSSPPQMLPSCAGGEDPSSSVGNGDVAKTRYLVTCAEGPSDTETGETDCNWYSPPPQPKSTAARREAQRMAAEGRAFERSAEGRRLRAKIDSYAGR